LPSAATGARAAAPRGLRTHAVAAAHDYAAKSAPDGTGGARLGHMRYLNLLLQAFAGRSESPM
jgi:hypothetical protein